MGNSNVEEKDAVTRLNNRRSIRLKGYDYSQKGLYFLTVCLNDRQNLFGIIKDGRISLYDAGHMIKRWWEELEKKYINIQLDEFCIMPNHFHGIIQIVTHNEKFEFVGANLCVRPAIGQTHRSEDGQTHRSEDGQTHRSAPTVGDMVRWFKTMTTNEYIANVKNNNWRPFVKRFWQRNYYEHIIRDESDLSRIREYITNNPLKWETDKYYVQQTKT
jgi:putative transposase